MKNDPIVGQKAVRHLQADLGNGFATYALVENQWYSVNLTPDQIISDVRWIASIRERDQITSILVSRANRNS